MDPLVALSPDVAELVFEHVEFKQRLVCTSVSRSWNAFTFDHCHTVSISMPVYVMNLADYSANLLLWLKRVQGVRHFTMRFYSQCFTPELLDTMASARWGGLQTLSISVSSNSAELSIRV